MQYTIHGELAQVANLELEKGETCWASKGSIVAIDPGLGWTLKVPGGASGAARRMMSGEGIALTFLAATSDGARPWPPTSPGRSSPGTSTTAR